MALRYLVGLALALLLVPTVLGQEPSPRRQIAAVAKSKYYKAAVRCTNCGYRGVMKLKIGKKLSTYHCPVCGEKSLKLDFDPTPELP